MDSSAQYIDGSYLDKRPEWFAGDSPWKAGKIAEIIAANKLHPRTICEVGCGAGAILGELSGILPGDILLRNRSEIRSFMAAGFAGPYKDTRVFGQPLDARMLGPGVAVVVTECGVLAPGETSVAPERTIRATWVLVKRGDDWFLATYQNGPKSRP